MPIWAKSASAVWELNLSEELEAQLVGELPGSEKHTELTTKLDKLDTGFRVLKVDSSNMTADYYKRPDDTTQEALALAVENIKEDRQPEDLLFQVMLDWGVDLALAITTETIAGKEVFFVASGSSENENAALAACFATDLDDDFSKALAKKHPLTSGLSRCLFQGRRRPHQRGATLQNPQPQPPKCAPSRRTFPPVLVTPTDTQIPAADSRIGLTNVNVYVNDTATMPARPLSDRRNAQIGGLLVSSPLSLLGALFSPDSLKEGRQTWQ